MIAIKNAALKPFEFLAGEAFPHRADVAHEATLGGAESMNEVDMSVHYEQGRWRGHLIHLDGLKTFIGRLRGE